MTTLTSIPLDIWLLILEDDEDNTMVTTACATCKQLFAVLHNLRWNKLTCAGFPTEESVAQFVQSLVVYPERAQQVRSLVDVTTPTRWEGINAKTT